MLSTHLGQAQDIPTRPGGLPSWPKALARAPRERANRNPSWTRIPLLLYLLDPIGGRGYEAGMGAALGGTPAN